VGEQASEEFGAIWRFYEAAHFEGLPIPDWGSTTQYLKAVQRYLDNSRSWGIYARWPDYWIDHLAAIAQHYGTPTRFLDWTKEALIAAYFAVPNLADEPREPIAVWIVDTDEHLVIDHGKSLRDSDFMRIVEIPYDLNQNARAQRGVFVNYLGRNDLNLASSISRCLLASLLTNSWARWDTEAP
jgi:hypothetical protein